MKGKITKRWINKLDDGKKYEVLSINGERYAIWDERYLNSFKEGDTVSYDFSEKGKYKNIDNIAKVEPEPKKSTKYESLNTKIITPAYRKDRQIVRMSCLKNAIFATQDMIDIDLNKKTDTIVDVARKFEDYITNFDDLQNQDDEDKE